MSSLSSLSLFYCAISDAGIRHLSTLTNLTHLNLDNRDITDSSMCHIAGTIEAPLSPPLNALPRKTTGPGVLSLVSVCSWCRAVEAQVVGRVLGPGL